jgi:hypothetical protein
MAVDYSIQIIPAPRTTQWLDEDNDSCVGTPIMIEIAKRDFLYRVIDACAFGAWTGDGRLAPVRHADEFPW